MNRITALIIVIAISPILILLSAFILLLMGRPVFFIQTRIGKDEKPFLIYKFRTMNGSNYDSDENRLANFGKFLRKTSLDELPQLFNIVFGDMNFIGPRPLLPQYLPLYSAEQKRRHLVKPGITGWSQIKGRNNLSWQEKFSLDTWYVDNRSVLLNFKIIIMTIYKVLACGDINQKGQATMEEFRGNN